MKMKRVLSILLAGTLLFTTAQMVMAEESGSGEKKVIQWMVPFTDTGIVKQYVDLYNSQQDAVIVETPDAGFATLADYFELLGLNIASDDPYDIFTMSPAYFNKYVEAGTAYCLDEYILDNEDVKDYAKDIVIRDGHAYAFPCGNDVFGLVVNLDMLEGAGHTVEDLNTWDGMLAAAADIANTYGNYGCLLALEFGGGYPEYLWYSTMWGEGGDINADIQGNITVTNSEKIAKAAMMWRDLITSESGSSEFTNSIDYLKGENCGMLVRGQEALILLEDAEFEWAFLPVPTSSEDGQSFTTLGGFNIMVNSNSDVAKEAAEFMNWLYFESDFMADLCLKQFQLSPLVSADENLDTLYVDTNYKLAYDLIEAGEIETKGELSFDSETLESISEMLTGIIYESTTDEEAIAYVEAFIEKTGATVVEE